VSESSNVIISSVMGRLCGTMSNAIIDATRQCVSDTVSEICMKQ
jgi:hypothetical protein